MKVTEGEVSRLWTHALHYSSLHVFLDSACRFSRWARRREAYLGSVGCLTEIVVLLGCSAGMHVLCATALHYWRPPPSPLLSLGREHSAVQFDELV
jgi:hypothetical protein